MKTLSFGIMSFMLAVSAWGETYHINAEGTGDYATIQAAVNAAGAGDVIVLQAGTYFGKGNCNINYQGKNITIRSVNPGDPGCVEKTIVDCYSSDPAAQHCAFIFQSGETGDSVVAGMTIQNGYLEMGYAGAGISCTNASSPTIANCLFRNCIVSLGSGGGAIACMGHSNPVIRGCIFVGNQSKSSRGGGAIFSETSSPTIKNCIFRDNTTSGEGGAICASRGTLTLSGSELSGNEVSEGTANGGAVSAIDCNMIIERCDIINNAIGENAMGRGGALSFNHCTVKIVDSNVGSNIAYDGGGIYCTNNTQINIERCRINKNRASLSAKVRGKNAGGGIFCENTSLNMRDCIVSYNQAHGSNPKTTGYGGGVFINRGFGSFTNCLLVRNLAWADHADTTNGCGGGLYASQARVTIDNCTFAHNTAKPEGQGSGFYSNGSASVTNSIVWANQGVQIADATVEVHHSNIQGGWPGMNNINANPGFVSGPMGDYYLSQISAGQPLQSPCVDGGSDAADNLDMHLLTTSTKGTYDTGTVDMGYHYVDTDVPCLDASPETLIIEMKRDRQSAEPQTITIRNSGNGVLHWTATTDVDWLMLDQDSGTCSDYEDISTISLDVDIDGLADRRYIGNITVSDPYARNNPKHIMVELRVLGAKIGLSQSEFYLNVKQGAGEPVNEVLSIFNLGGSVLDWHLSDPCDWLRVEPESGSVTTEIDDVDIIVDTSGLTTGTHTCMLTVNAEDAMNSPQTVKVQVNMLGPMILLSQEDFSFETYQEGETPPGQTLTIQNAGGGVLDWKIKEECRWLSVDPQSGSTASGVSDVNVSVDVSGLESGIYTGRFDVYCDEEAVDPRTVSIRLVVIRYNVADLDRNLIVDFRDLAILAPYLARKTESSAATERGQASHDTTFSQDVNDSKNLIDFKILTLFCQNWLETETLELKIPDLVSHWQLNGDAKDAAGSNHGVNHGGTWAAGKKSQGLDFKEVDDRVVIEDHDSLTPGEEFTMAFWIYNRGNGGGGVYKARDCDNDSTMTDDPGSYSLRIKPDSALVEFTVFASDVHWDSVISFSPISTDNWHHIAATFNRSAAKVYIDGVFNGFLKMKAASIQNDSHPLRLGYRRQPCDTDKDTLSAESIFDEIRIYARALTEEEVKTLYTWER